MARKALVQHFKDAVNKYLQHYDVRKGLTYIYCMEMNGFDKWEYVDGVSLDVDGEYSIAVSRLDSAEIDFLSPENVPSKVLRELINRINNNYNIDIDI